MDTLSILCEGGTESFGCII